MRKKRILKTIAILLVATLLLPSNAYAKKKVKLSNTKKTVTVGKTATIKLLNNSKSVKWSTTNGKIKIIKKTKKYAKIKGVKKGASYIKAKVGKKIYKCKVTVKNANNTKTTEKNTLSYISDFSIKNKEIYSENDVSISVSNTTKTLTDIQVEFLVQNNSEKDYSIAAHSYAINELMAGEHLYGSDVNVPAGKKAKFSIKISKEWFIENKITEIKKIDVVFWGYYNNFKEWDSGNVIIDTNLNDGTGYYSSKKQEIYTDDNVSVWYLYGDNNEYTFLIKNKINENTSYTIENCSVNDWAYDLGSCKYDLYSEPIHSNTNDTFTIVVDNDFMKENSISAIENIEFSIKLSRNEYPFSISTDKILINLK